MKSFLLISPFILFFNCSLFMFYSIEKIDKKFDPIKESKDSKADLQVFWVGHANFILRIHDKWIITDPNFSERVGVLVKRFIEPGIEINNLPEMDSVLISHTHLDHLDKPSLKMIKGNPKVFVPEGGVTYIPKENFEEIVGVNSNFQKEFNDLKITAIQVKHFGGRWLIDNLWDGDPFTGYIIESKGITIFFAGDTGYDETLFKEVGNKYKIDLALIPVGPVGMTTSANDLGNSVHVNPYGAIKIFEDCKANYMIPMHHSTFYKRGGKELEMLGDAVNSFPGKERIFMIKVGEKLEFEKKSNSLKKL